MIKLTDFKEDDKFYRGTVIVIKDAHISPRGNFDIKYCMIADSMTSKFRMLDLYKSIGNCIWHDLEANVDGHFAVDKKGIKNWVTEHFNIFYTEEGKAKWIPLIDDIVYIEQLDDYFTQANRDIFV